MVKKFKLNLKNKQKQNPNEINRVMSAVVNSTQKTKILRLVN